MAYFLFKCWHEKLFVANRNQLVLQKSDLPIEFLKIDETNVGWVKELRAEVYVAQFEYQLSMGDVGFYAVLNGKPVAYGWCKHENSDDYFFKISKDVCYLCRFFTHENVRGHNIYPAIISALTERESACDTFYIDVERGNLPSENGLRKVGFTFFKEFGFIRGFKKTFNKYKLQKRDGQYGKQN